jgi:hypothetical protein
MSSERSGGLRATIAKEAARLMYEEDIKEYFTAKRMAAKRVLGRVEGRRLRYRPLDLPSNGEIRDALLSLARATEGKSRTNKLFAMRVVALEAMAKLSEFEPRLIGSVSTGHIRRGSDIVTSLFCDDEEHIELRLQELGWRFQTERVSIHKFGEIREYLHHHIDERFRVELTVYPKRELRFRPRSSTDGLPIVRVTAHALETMLEREHAIAYQRYRDTGVIAGLSEADTEDEPSEGAAGDIANDEPCIAEPGEADDPTQLYDPLPGFESFSS